MFQKISKIYDRWKIYILQMKSSTYFHSQATEYGLAHTGRRKRTARRMTLAKARFHLRWVIFHCIMFLESWSRSLFFYRPMVHSLPRSFPFISQVNNLSSSIIWNHTLLELLFGTDIYPVSTDYIPRLYIILQLAKVYLQLYTLYHLVIDGYKNFLCSFLLSLKSHKHIYISIFRLK